MAIAIIPYTILAQGLYSGVVHAIGAITIGTCKIVKSIYVQKKSGCYQGNSGTRHRS